LLIIPSRNDHERKEFWKKEADAMASTDGSGECFRRWPYVLGKLGKWFGEEPGGKQKAPLPVGSRAASNP
jgi:hypothetical protein